MTAELMRFDTERDAAAWIDRHGLLCWAHACGLSWIVVCSTPQGMLAATSPSEGVILDDW